MAKKSTRKTTTKSKPVQGKRSTEPKAIRSSPPAKRPAAQQKETADRGAPIEHYHGEPNRGKKTGDPGSLDQETLDRDAPYNKTYGGLREERGSDS